MTDVERAEGVVAPLPDARGCAHAWALHPKRDALICSACAVIVSGQSLSAAGFSPRKRQSEPRPTNGDVTWKGMPPCDVDVELRARVALMRELGVLEWDGIRLAPEAPPSPPIPPLPEPPPTAPRSVEEEAFLRKKAKYEHEFARPLDDAFVRRLP